MSTTENSFAKITAVDAPAWSKLIFTATEPTWALVLIPAESSNRKAELVVARQLGKGWEISSLDTVDASEVPVIWRQGPGKYDDISEPKTIRATNPVIVICGYEVWARLYAWTGKEVEKVQLSD